ncbi:prolyl oligopeptidase family serine peptidase [bacterium]|jgi:polyhydroxybutyrate depolymerase|nr:prolyl oligopeptidase family serine peptidase [bacterium]
MKHRSLLVSVLLILVGWGFLDWHYNETPKRIPKASPQTLAGEYRANNTVISGGIDRTFSYYLPSTLTEGAALIFVLHGSISSGEAIRKMTGNEFDLLAETNQYIPVYANGFDNHWNDCRASADYKANTQNIDDIAHLAFLIDLFAERYQIDPNRVFVTGHSNGGQMAYRVALEAPHMVRAVAALSANLPIDDNFDCVKSGIPTSIAIFNGTEDNINPYYGGTVRLGSNESRGLVLTTEQTTNYWTKLIGADIASPDKVIQYPETDGMPNTSVIATHWNGLNGTQVQLFRLQGSGHVIASKLYDFPDYIGPNASDISGPEEIIKFFMAHLKSNL